MDCMSNEFSVLTDLVVGITVAVSASFVAHLSRRLAKKSKKKVKEHLHLMKQLRDMRDCFEPGTRGWLILDARLNEEAELLGPSPIRQGVLWTFMVLGVLFTAVPIVAFPVYLVGHEFTQMSSYIFLGFGVVLVLCGVLLLHSAARSIEIPQWLWRNTGRDSGPAGQPTDSSRVSRQSGNEFSDIG
jgi:hypothetical protein